MRIGLAALVFAAALLVALQVQAFSAQAPMQPTSYPFSNPGCYSTSSSTVEITCNEILTGTLEAQNIQVDGGAYLDTNGFEIDALGTFTVKSGGYVVNFTSGGGLNGQGGYNSGGAPGCCATGLSPLPASKGTSSKLSFSPAGKAVQALSFQGSGCYVLRSNGVPHNDQNAPQDGHGCDGQIDGSFDSYVSGGIGGTGSSGGQCTASTSGTGGDGPYQTGVIHFGGAGGNSGGGSAGVANPGGLTSPCQSDSSGSGGNGGGYIYIQAGEFYNYGIINASGSPGTPDDYYPGGGGGGGYVHITILTQDPGQIVLGKIMANGGNTTLQSNSGDRACAGSGGGGVINITIEYAMSQSQLDTSGLAVHGGSVQGQGTNCPSGTSGPVIYGNGHTGNELGRPGQIVFTHLPKAKTPSACSPPYGPYSATQGYCFFTSSTSFTTSYGQTGLGGSIVPSTGPQQTTPATSNVLKYDDNNAQWLITCPSTPDSSNTMLYYSQDPGTYTGGDLCLAKNSNLNTLLQVNTTVQWDLNNPANATVQIYMGNAVAADIRNLGLAGEVNTTVNYLSAGSSVYQPFAPSVPEGACAAVINANVLSDVPAGCGWSEVGSGTLYFQGNSYSADYYDNVSNSFLLWVVWTDASGALHIGTVPLISSVTGTPLSAPLYPSNVISNGYNTQSYIFGQVPSTPQQGLWSWSLEYADLGNADAAKLSQPQQTFPEAGASFSGLEAEINGCKYKYSFSYSLNFQSINNANIPIPINQQGTPPNRLVFNGYVYSPVYDISSQLKNSGYALYYDCWPDSGACPPVLGYGQLYLNGNLQGSYSSSGSYVYDSASVQGVNGNLPPGNYIVATQQVCWAEGIFPYPCYSARAIPKSAMVTKDVQFLPYFLYNLSIPATVSDVNSRTQYLNLSFDMYSPHNYMEPGNFLDPFPLSSGSGFFATVNGNVEEFPSNSLASGSSTAFSTGTTEFTVVPPSSKQVSNNYNINLAGLISDIIPNQQTTISNPIFISASPNDYIYVLTSSSSCTSSFIVCTSTTTTTTIYKFRFIPQGYYNMTNAAPDFAAGQYTSGYSNWKNAWLQYWKYDLNAQASTLYLTNFTQLSNTISTWCFYTNCVSGGSILSALQSMEPTALTSDYADDVFMVGNERSSSGSGITSGAFELAAIPSVGDVIANVIQSSSAKGFSATDLIAADPGGQFIYLANPNYGAIPIFAANTLNYVGNFTLSYNTSTGQALNLTAYMEDGGPFGNATVASYYTSNKLVNSLGLPNMNDTAQFHHPVALFSTGGVLYVVDNWSIISATQDSQSAPLRIASILMLRAFLYNGTEIPLHPSPKYDLALSQSAADLAKGSNGIVPSYPPYGWPLAANISVGNGNYISYCIAGCSSTPLNPGANHLSGYETIGPMINLMGGTGGQLSFDPAFNGSIYMLTYDKPPNCAPIIFSFGSPCGASGPSINPNPYTLLLSFKPNILNYTKLSNGAGAPYTCDISTNSIDSPCVYDSNVGSLNPPFAEVPSSFSYVTAEGAPQQYMSESNVYQSLYPTGYTNNQTNNNNAANTVTSNATSSNALSLNPSYFSVGSFTPSIQSPTYINSTIGGYVVLPYKAQYQFDRSWNVYTSSTCSASSFYNYVGADSSGNNDITVDGYSVYPAPVNSKSVNITIEGGQTYLQNPNSGQFYDANISDANLIVPPELYYKIFSDRVFGNIYINQSVEPSNTKELSTPLFINATHNYNYSLVKFTQEFGGQSEPGYAIEESVPLSFIYPHTGPAAAPQGTGLTYYLGKSLLTYSNFTKTQFISLFQIYSRASQLDGILLNLQGNNNILGYNRFIYTFIDRFNNTIYMPLDADLANLTTISMNVATLINATNDNETLIIVNGTAGYRTGVLGGAYTPLPAGSDIYLYYDTNLNFYNSTGTDPSSLQYAEWQDLCAFDPSMQCQLANPLESTTLQSSGMTSSAYVGHVDFSTQYNGTKGSNGENLCSPQPKGLLSVVQSNNCNIYGANALANLGGPAQYDQATNSYEYCVPNFNNGTGTYTTQLGLIAVLQTNSNGYFQDNSITTCGMGSGIVTAKYYGAPSPQPITFQQRSMPQAASGPIQICYPSLTGKSCVYIPTAPLLPSQEFNYTYSPNQTSVSFQIGNFALSFGSTGAIALLVGMAAALVVLLSRLGIARRQPH